jgi:thymidylate synthase (FAD)
MCSTPNAAEFIERAGRTCYKSEDKITAESAGKFVKMLLERGHESVIEHAHASFLVVCDRGVSHEFVRHRIFSYSQESTRYCDYCKAKFDGQISVVRPPLSKDGAEAIWRAANEFSEKSYFALRELGEPPEIARSVLMTDLKTELVGTANFREWRHFLRMRAVNPKAHPQMREIAIPIGKALLELCPQVFEDFREKLSA